MLHKSVLLKEAIDGLDLKNGSVFVDATFGAGGHSMEVCRRFGDTVSIVAIDLYERTLFPAVEAVRQAGGKIEAFQANFRDINRVLSDANKTPDAILFDLGWSTDEFESSGRGFSFQKDEPLIMSYGEGGFTAAEIVNGWSENDLYKIFKEYGEERNASRFAKLIVEARRRQKIMTTAELLQVLGDGLKKGKQGGRVHFATKVFQALRIAVNDELGALSETLEKSFRALRQGGRIAVISFHSLEDRIVKNYFREKARSGEGQLLTKKPIVPSRAEVVDNSRSRSAKLRIISKI